MNILYCGDKNIKDGVLLSVLSLIGCVREPLHIYLLTADIRTDTTRFRALPEDFARSLDRLVRQKETESFVRRFDMTDLFLAQPPTANLGTRFTPCCMLRLYADLVEELPDRLLYLDSDVLCRSAPGSFYHQDMEAWELAGCLDHYGSWFFRRNFLKRDYVNSGVLLLNLDMIRSTGLFAMCREYCRSKKMFMPDQSAINKLSTRKKLCSRIHNEQRKLQPDTVFQHFTTSFRFFPYFHSVSVKPWNIRGMHETLHLHAYDELLAEYTRLKQSFETEEICL